MNYDQWKTATPPEYDYEDIEVSSVTEDDTLTVTVETSWYDWAITVEGEGDEAFTTYTRRGKNVYTIADAEDESINEFLEDYKTKDY